MNIDCNYLHNLTHWCRQKISLGANNFFVVENLTNIPKKSVCLKPEIICTKNFKKFFGQGKIDSDYKIAIFATCRKFLLLLGEIPHMNCTLDCARSCLVNSLVADPFS